MHDGDYPPDDFFDTIGQEYAADNIDDITRYHHISSVAMAAIDAHCETISAAEVEMKKAEVCVENEAWAEAIFHAARALDGYVTEVFVYPFRRLALAPFKDALPHAGISDTFFREVNALESGIKFACVGIAATCEEHIAEHLIGRMRAFVKQPKTTSDITWSIRNTVLHSLTEPMPAEASQFVSVTAALLRDLSETLKTRAEEEC